MTGFHAHRHTSLLTRLRTHRLPRLVAAQHPETEAGLVPAQVHLHVLVVRSWGNETTGAIQIRLSPHFQVMSSLFLNSVTVEVFVFYLSSPQGKPSSVGQVLEIKRCGKHP